MMNEWEIKKLGEESESKQQNIMDNTKESTGIPSMPHRTNTTQEIYSTLCKIDCPIRIHLNCGLSALCVSTNSSHIQNYIKEYYSPLIIKESAFISYSHTRYISFIDQDMLLADQLPDLQCSRSMDSELIPISWESLYKSFNSGPPEILSWKPIFLNRKPKEPKAGKRAKLEYHDTQNSNSIPIRIICKTGKSLFFLYQLNDSSKPHIALGSFSRGPEPLNQVVNHFFNWALESRLHNSNHLLFHAGGALKGKNCLIVAGDKGKGKTTAILRLLHRNWMFLSNDRILVNTVPSSSSDSSGPTSQTLQSSLINHTTLEHKPTVFCFPKHPRVLPGTLYTVPELSNMLPNDVKDTFNKLQPEEYRTIKSKYTINVFKQFPLSNIKVSELTLQYQFHTMLILSWDWDSTEPTSLKQMDWSSNEDLELLDKYLPEITKHPGCIFHTDTSGFTDNWHSSKYINVLKNVSVLFAIGKVDFESLDTLLDQQFE